MSQLGLLLDVALLDTIDIPDATLDFAVEDGKVTTKPFSFFVNDIAIRAGGVTGFDKTLDWTMELRIPKKYIGASGQKNITSLLQKLPMQGMKLDLPDTVLVDASLKGSVLKPQIGLDVKKTATRILEGVKQDVQKKITDELRDRLLPGGVDSSQSASPESPARMLKESLKKVLPGDDSGTDAGNEEKSEADTAAAKPLLPGLLKSIFAPLRGVLFPGKALLILRDFSRTRQPLPIVLPPQKDSDNPGRSAGRIMNTSGYALVQRWFAEERSLPWLLD